MVRRFDVFNGDADGLCAAVQWRWHAPVDQLTVVTGLKREIALLARIEHEAEAGDEVNVFDLAMQRNQSALRHLLDAGVRVRYVDHHATGEVPHHPLLQAHVDTGSEVCTSLLVDRLLNGRHRAWALVGAYGDNLAGVADALAHAAGMQAPQRAALRRLGEVINYNAYGEREQDVHTPPRLLYERLVPHESPFDMLAQDTIADELDALRLEDLARATALRPLWQGADGCVLCLPNEPWAARVVGVLANELANARPDRAHAVLKHAGGGYAVSVRAPLSRPVGAHHLCERFGGCGRARAAGIDLLPEAALPAFIDAFAAMAWGG